MRIKYENAIFDINFKTSMDILLLKLSIKKKIGSLINKPYVKDIYLEYVETILEEKNNSLIIDVGANIGMTTIPLALKYPLSQFYAIEPHPIPASKLIMNCRMNKIKNIRLIPLAIDQEPGVSLIYTNSKCSGGHRLSGFKDRIDVDENFYIPILVGTNTLNNILKKISPDEIDLLKIDTDGHEIPVLLSIKEQLTPNFIKKVIAEYCVETFTNVGKTAWDMITLMKNKGYKCKILQTNKEILSSHDVPNLPKHVPIDLLFY